MVAKRSGGGGRHQFAKNEIDGIRQPIANIGGRYAQGLHPMMRQCGVTAGVPVATPLVRTAVDLHRQAASQANEVEIVAQERMLTAEVKALFS